MGEVELELLQIPLFEKGLGREEILATSILVSSMLSCVFVFYLKNMFNILSIFFFFRLISGPRLTLNVIKFVN